MRVSSSRIIAVDPGKRCGMFTFHLQTGIWSACEDDPFTIVRAVEDLVSQDIHISWYVVAERFTTSRAITTQQPEALEVIGALRYVARRHHQGDITLQSRSVKSRVPNSMLRAIDWWHESHGGHSLDAARHALVLLVEKFPHSETVRRLTSRIELSERTRNGENDDDAETYDGGQSHIQGPAGSSRPDRA